MAGRFRNTLRAARGLLVRAGLLQSVNTRPPSSRGRGDWLDLMGPGSWQKDLRISDETSLAFFAVFAAVTLIASDVAKIDPELRKWDEAAKVYVEAESTAFSPVLRKPNRFQTWQQFAESWLLSKLIKGNAYILKIRDPSRIVRRLVVLDPDSVTPLVSESGLVFYRINRDPLAGIPNDLEAVPAEEIIHDRFNCLFHPLVGISPLYAAKLAANQGLRIQENSAVFFGNMSRPSGILTAPDQISDETAERLKREWEKNYSGGNIGKVAVLGDKLDYKSLSVNAEEAQLAEQLKISAEQVASAFHVPGYLIGVDKEPGGSVEAMYQRYYGQCLQRHFEALEALLEEGLGVTASGYKVEFDLDDLFRMDSKTRAEVDGMLVQRAILAPNEARRRWDRGPVAGGDSPMMQEQNYSLAALAKRDAQENPFASSSPAPAPTPPSDPAANDTAKAIEALFARLEGLQSAIEKGVERAAEAATAAAAERIGAEQEAAATARREAEEIERRALEQTAEKIARAFIARASDVTRS